MYGVTVVLRLGNENFVKVLPVVPRRGENIRVGKREYRVFDVNYDFDGAESPAEFKHILIETTLEREGP